MIVDVEHSFLRTHAYIFIMLTGPAIFLLNFVNETFIKLFVVFGIYLIEQSFLWKINYIGIE